MALGRPRLGPPSFSSASNLGNDSGDARPNTASCANPAMQRTGAEHREAASINQVSAGQAKRDPQGDRARNINTLVPGTFILPVRRRRSAV